MYELNCLGFLSLSLSLYISSLYISPLTMRFLCFCVAGFGDRACWTEAVADIWLLSDGSVLQPPHCVFALPGQEVKITVFLHCTEYQSALECKDSIRIIINTHNQ